MLTFTDPGLRKDAIFSVGYILPLLWSKRKIFVRSLVGTTAAEMFPWRQGTAEHISCRQDACYSPSRGTMSACAADGEYNEGISLLQESLLARN